MRTSTAEIRRTARGLLGVGDARGAGPGARGRGWSAGAGLERGAGPARAWGGAIRAAAGAWDLASAAAP